MNWRVKCTARVGEGETSGRNVRIQPLIWLIGLCACAGQRSTMSSQLAPAAPRPEVHWTTPDWAYRVGPVVFAGASKDSSRISAELASKAAQLGCHAVVSVVIPRPDVTPDDRPWGFCVFRVNAGASKPAGVPNPLVERYR